MAFKAVIHGYSNPERKQEILKTIARIRVEMVSKYLKEAGVADDTVQACVGRELTEKKTTSGS